MITIDDYFGKFKSEASDSHIENARSLLAACAKLEVLARADGVKFPENPKTKSGVSGDTYGGFRPKTCPIGAEKSSHKEALAVDRYDPGNAIDEWCMSNVDRLELCGIYLEHPSATESWSHWTIKPPKSGRRIFYP